MATTTNRKKPAANSAAAKAKAAGARVPQDRQTASNDVESTIIDYNYHGEVYRIDTDNFDDIEFLEMLSTSFTNALRILMGSDQKRLIEQMKAEDPKGTGKARASVMREFFEDLQEYVRPLVG